MEKKKVKINKIDLAKYQHKKIAIIKASFNYDITDQMLKNIVDQLDKAKIKYQVYEVPGVFEIPYKIKKLDSAKKTAADIYITIGCLIKGETAHFEYLAQAASYGLMKLSIKLVKPVIFNILTCYNKKQALKRLNNINIKNFILL